MALGMGGLAKRKALLDTAFYTADMARAKGSAWLG